jgi:hypothetical protein
LTRRAWSMSPLKNAEIISEMGPDAQWPATLITPAAPMARSGRVRASSPDYRSNPSGT